MRNAVLGATRVPGRSSRPIVPCTSAIRVLRAFSLAHDPAHNLLLKPGCCHFAQVIGVTSDLRITFPILLKICASTRWLWGVACLQSAAGITRFGGPVSLVARGSLRPVRWLRFFEQNLCVDKWNSCPGVRQRGVSLQADPRCARYAATQRGSEA